MRVRFRRAYSFRLKRNRTSRVPFPPEDSPLPRWRFRIWALRMRWARFLDRVLGEPPPEPAVKLPLVDDFWRDPKNWPRNVYVPGPLPIFPVEPDDE